MKEFVRFGGGVELFSLMYKIWSRQDNLESNITPRNLPEDRYWSGALYKKSGGLGNVRKREKRMGKDLEVEK